MSDPNLQAELCDSVRSIARIPAHVPIAADSRLVEDLGVDSLDLVSVLMKMEDHYDIKIELDEVPNIRSVTDLAGHLETLRGGKSAAA